MAKIFGSNQAVKSCLDAIQIFGGNGYSRENPVERYLRDAKLLTIGEGTTEVLKMLVGRTELSS
jgi:alkylation response protein AidB-like acyl-CoA dehydrogenase